MRASRVLAFIATITVAVTPGGAANASHVAGWTSRITVSVTGGDPNHYLTLAPQISDDGRYVAFSSEASNLVPGDTNGVRDVFVRDTRTAATTRVSVSHTGQQLLAASEEPSISGDGRYVAFVTAGHNIAPGGHDSWTNVFVRDRVAGTTLRAGPPTGPSGPSVTEAPAITADGRYVVFSTSRSLVTSDINGYFDIYMWTRTTGAVERMTLSAGGENTDGNSHYPDASDDGRYVSFHSTAANLVVLPSRPSSTYVRDRQTGITTLVSVASDGTPSNGASGRARISGDGRYVVFESAANNLVPRDLNGVMPDAFLHDRITKATEMVNVGSGGEPIHEGGYEPSINRDGRYVAFRAPGRVPAHDRVLRRDRRTGVTIQIDVSTAGVPANNDGWLASISADGRRIAFRSAATNLVPRATTGEYEIYSRTY